jgi:hypothetical protein
VIQTDTAPCICVYQSRMVSFKNIFNKREPKVLGRRSDEPYVTPYVPPPMPSAEPPAVPEPMPPFTPDYGDDKVDLGATYSPGIPPGAPPGYVSREPSTATPPYIDRAALPPAGYERRSVSPITAPYERPILPPTTTAYERPPITPIPTTAYERSAAPPIATTYAIPPITPITVHYDRPPIPTSPAPSMPSRPSRQPPPGDLPLERAAGTKITPEELRDLREMIRQRYQLDVQIWSERFLRERDRDITQAKIKQAEALMTKIRRTVITWNKPEYFEHGTGDYESFQEISRRIHSPGKRDWVNEPPWLAANRGFGPERRMR